MTWNYCPACGSKLSLNDTDHNTRWITCENCHQMFRNTSRQQNTKGITNLLLIMVLLGLVVSLFFFVFIPVSTNAKLQEQIEFMQPILKELAIDQSIIFANFVAETESLANSISDLDATTQEGAMLIEAAQQQFLNTAPNFSSVYSAYESKHMILVPNQELPPSYDPTSRPWYRMVVEKPISQWSEPYHDYVVTDSMVATFVTPLFNVGEPDKVRGVLGVDFNLTQSLKPIIDYNVANPTVTVHISIVDKSGVIIYHANKELLGLMLPIPELIDAIQQGELSIVEYQFNGSVQTGIIEKIENTDFFIIGAVQP